jgi:hypothetical protein
MKIRAAKRIIIVHGNQQLARDIERDVSPGQRNMHHVEANTQPPPFLDPIRNKEKENFKDDCQIEKVLLDKHMPGNMVTITAKREEAEENDLPEFLCKNKYVFAWSASDLHDVSRDIIEHRLNIDPSIKPKKKKLRKMSDDKGRSS